MTNTAIARQTYILDVEDTTNVAPMSVLVLRDNDTGEVYTKTVMADHRAVEAEEERLEGWGVTVLMRLEGEADLSTGEASVWVRH